MSLHIDLERFTKLFCASPSQPFRELAAPLADQSRIVDDDDAQAEDIPERDGRNLDRFVQGRTTHERNTQSAKPMWTLHQQFGDPRRSAAALTALPHNSQFTEAYLPWIRHGRMILAISASSHWFHRNPLGRG